MRILLVTDAWVPQVNGVVRTLRRVRRSAGAGPRGRGDHARAVSHRAVPDLPGDPPGPGGRGRHRAADRSVPAAMRPYRDRGAARLRGAPLLPPPWAAVHDLLPHPLSRISPRAPAGAAGARLRGDALVPPAVARGDGRDPDHPRGARGPRLRQRQALVARRRHHAVPARPRAGARPAAAGLSLRRPGCGREEPGGVARPRAAAAASWWSATGRRSPAGPGIPRCASSAPSRARSWPATTPAATCSCSRAGPTPSAWSCSRRWPAACRSPPIPVPGPLDVIGGNGFGVLDEDLGRPDAGAGDSPASAAAPTPPTSPGGLRRAVPRQPAADQPRCVDSGGMAAPSNLITFFARN